MKKKILIEVFSVTLALVLVTSALYSLQSIPFIKQYFALIFAILFLYAPVYVLKRAGRKLDFLDANAGAYFKSFLVFLAASAIVFPLFALVSHLWIRFVYGVSGPNFILPADILKYSAFQLVMVALPEEFFFRGYMQSSLKLIFPAKWRILGVDLGWAWPLTAVIFAFAHSMVSLQWWHFSIIFPALLFGYLRERTGTITAALLFHGASNVVMYLIQSAYV